MPLHSRSSRKSNSNLELTLICLQVPSGLASSALGPLTRSINFAKSDQRFEIFIFICSFHLYHHPLSMTPGTNQHQLIPFPRSSFQCRSSFQYRDNCHLPMDGILSLISIYRNENTTKRERPDMGLALLCEPRTPYQRALGGTTPHVHRTLSSVLLSRYTAFLSTYPQCNKLTRITKGRRVLSNAVMNERGNWFNNKRLDLICVLS